MLMGSFLPDKLSTVKGQRAGPAHWSFPHRIRVVALWASVTVILFLLPTTSVAEGVTVSGLAFPVDAIVGVNEANVTVRLGKKETLVPRTDLERFVVEETLGDRTLTEKLDPRGVLRFVEASFNGGNPRQAGLALRALRWRPELNEEDLLESLDVLSGIEQRESDLGLMAKFALVPVFEPERYPRVTARLVIMIGMSDPTWVREHAVPYAYGVKRALHVLLDQELADRLRRRDLEGSEALVRFSREVLGPEDPMSQQAGMWLDRARDLVKAATERDVEALGKALLVESSDPSLGAVLSPIAMEGLHQAATTALEGGDSERALDILSRVDLLKRSQATHELTRTSLERLSSDKMSVLQRAEIRAYLDFLSRNDPALAAVYQEKLLALILRLLDEGAVSETEPLLERIRQLAPAATGVVNDILVRQAEEYLSQGLHGLAERKIRESRSSGLGALWLRCRLAIATMSPATMGAFLAIFFSLTILLTLSLVRGRRRGPLTSRVNSVGEATNKIPVEEVGNLSGVEETDEDRPRGFVVNELRRLSPSAQEYQRCLEVLGLTANADLRSIKNAYRRLVKDVHPDRNKSNDEAAASRFIELTRVYDRILELRKEFGYED